MSRNVSGKERSTGPSRANCMRIERAVHIERTVYDVQKQMWLKTAKLNGSRWFRPRHSRSTTANEKEWNKNSIFHTKHQPHDCPCCTGFVYCRRTVCRASNPSHPPRKQCAWQHFLIFLDAPLLLFFLVRLLTMLQRCCTMMPLAFSSNEPHFISLYSVSYRC